MFSKKYVGVVSAPYISCLCHEAFKKIYYMKSRATFNLLLRLSILWMSTEPGKHTARTISLYVSRIQENQFELKRPHTHIPTLNRRTGRQGHAGPHCFRHGRLPWAPREPQGGWQSLASRRGISWRDCEARSMPR
ncbi:unnamed protein product [Ixodes pacificus]